jgi:large subunit ribosomal protein L21
MFAVVRTGGKQYRVALGDKIVVEKVAGEAGQRIDITDVLLAGEGSELKSVQGLTVGAEIIAQAKGDKVTVFKKRRRHNYRRKQGHRQQHTILRIVAIGDQKAEKKAPAKADKPAPAEKPVKAPAAPAPAAPAAADSGAKAPVDAPATENPAPDNQAQANPAKAKAQPKPAATPAAKPAAEKPAAKASTKNAAPAKGAAKKPPKAK